MSDQLNDMTQWLSRVSLLQSERMTPARREQVKARAETLQRASRMARRAKTLSRAAKVSKRAWSNGMSSVSALSRRREHTMAMGMDAAEQQVQQQLDLTRAQSMAAMRQCSATNALMTSVKSKSRSTRNESGDGNGLLDDSDGEEDESGELMTRLALECASATAVAAPAAPPLQLSATTAGEGTVAPQLAQSAQAESSPAVQHLRRMQATGNHAAVDEAVDAVLDVGADEMSVLLGQLRVEPDSDKERASKFELYEQFADTVSTGRRALHAFWSACKPEFTGAGAGACAAVERSLAQLDRAQHCTVHFNEHRWFVHDMLAKADENNRRVESLLQGIKTKLELLAQQDECPICLEPLISPACATSAGAMSVGGGTGAAGSGVERERTAERKVVVLGCCHKVCEPCWRHWQQLKGQRAFCPLCRNDEFLGNVVEGHDIPAGLFARARSISRPLDATRGSE